MCGRSAKPHVGLWATARRVTWAHLRRGPSAVSGVDPGDGWHTRSAQALPGRQRLWRDARGNRPDGPTACSMVSPIDWML